MAKVQEIGPYSAYAIAVKYGYKGTEEEWIKEQEANRKAAEASAAAAAQSAKDAAASASGVAQSGQQAVQSIKDAQTAAEQAIDTAKQQAVQAAQAEAEKAATSAGQAASSAAEAAQSATNAAAEVGKVQSAGTSAVQAVQAAQNTATEAVSAAQQTATQTVSEAQATAVSAVQEAGAAQTSAIESAGTAAVADVSNAKTEALSQISAAGTAQVSAVGTAGADAVEDVNDAKTAALEAIDAANADLPSPTQSDVGKVPAVNEDGTGYELRDISSNDELNNKIDALYNILANKCTTKAELDQLFVDWWHGQWVEGESSYNNMLARWFGNVLHDDRIHGVKLPLFATSQSPTGELTDDSVGLVCEPSTEAEAKRDDFAHLAQFWCVEVAAEKNTDGTHTIYACEFIDPLDVVRAGGPDDGRHLVWVLQKNTYTREWDEDGYRYFKMQCDPAEGWETWPQGTDRQNHVYPYMANPKYGAGLEDDGTIGCRTGLPPVNYSSHNDNVALWRKRGSQYAGASGNLLKWQLAMIWLKYGVKGNSGTIEGHSSQNLQYAAAVSESGVQRILLTTAQASNFKVGYNVIVGTPNNAAESGQTDRGQASMYSIRKNKRVTRIETVEVGEQSYGAVYVEDGDNTFDTTAGTTYISNMPYWSGWNDTVQGNDGSRYDPTNGHDTGLIQKTEFQPGGYLILADELWQWGTDEDGNFTFDCYTCHDQTKVTPNGSISGDYEKQEDLTLTFPQGTADGWLYIEDTAIAADRGVLWPAKVSTEAGSGTGVKDGFAVYPRTSGVRAGWCCCYLCDWGSAGLAARASYSGTAGRGWGRLCWLPRFVWVSGVNGLPIGQARGGASPLTPRQAARGPPFNPPAQGAGGRADFCKKPFRQG